MVKNLPVQERQEIRVLSLGQKDPLEEEIATHASILSRKSYGQMSLAGYSLWGCKELDMTEYACMQLNPLVFKNYYYII